jgi:transcriptional regulator with XRE-family HTH domain
MQLEEYFANRWGLTVPEFAARLGVYPHTVHRWRIGRRMPSLLEIARIEELTAGQVTPADWIALARIRAPGEEEARALHLAVKALIARQAREKAAAE